MLEGRKKYPSENILWSGLFMLHLTCVCVHAAAEDWSRQTRVLPAGDQTDRREILRYTGIYITGVRTSC